MGSYGIPHLFVPGNHDPSFSYAHQTPEILTELDKTTNLHNYCYQIQLHLWIVGFGGSVPVTLADGTVRKNSSYPFTADMKDEVLAPLLSHSEGRQRDSVDALPADDYWLDWKRGMSSRVELHGSGQEDERGVLLRKSESLQPGDLSDEGSGDVERA